MLQTAEKPRVGPHFHPSWYTRSVIPPKLTVYSDNLLTRGYHWLLPWTVRTYPGLRKGVESLLGVSWKAIVLWRSGKASFPPARALMLAEAIEGRCRSGLALVEELRAYAAVTPGRGQKSTGFCVVDAVTGRDKRHRKGNRPKRSADAALGVVSGSDLTDAAREERK